jgi:hypothetical protein
METDNIYLFQRKLEYLKLLLVIIRLRYNRDDSPVEFLSKARKFGQLIGVSEKE